MTTNLQQAAQMALEALEQFATQRPFGQQCPTRDAITALTTALAQAGEPFGYFRAEPFGWTDCAETDEGAIALYTHPAADGACAAFEALCARIYHEGATPLDWPEYTQACAAIAAAKGGV